MWILIIIRDVGMIIFVNIGNTAHVVNAFDVQIEMER